MNEPCKGCGQVHERGWLKEALERVAKDYAKLPKWIKEADKRDRKEREARRKLK